LNSRRPINLTKDKKSMRYFLFLQSLDPATRQRYMRRDELYVQQVNAITR